MRVSVPVAVLEYDEGGRALWVHNDQGATVLRLQLLGGKFRSRRGRSRRTSEHRRKAESCGAAGRQRSAAPVDRKTEGRASVPSLPRPWQSCSARPAQPLPVW